MILLQVHYDLIFTATHLSPASATTICYIQLEGESHTLDRKPPVNSQSTSKECIYWNILIFVFFFLSSDPFPGPLEAAMLLPGELGLLQQKCFKNITIQLLISTTSLWDPEQHMAEEWGFLKRKKWSSKSQRYP